MQSDRDVVEDPCLAVVEIQVVDADLDRRFLRLRRRRSTGVVSLGGGRQ